MSGERIKILSVDNGPVEGKPFDSHGETTYVTEWMCTVQRKGAGTSGMKVRCSTSPALMSHRSCQTRIWPGPKYPGPRVSSIAPRVPWRR